MPALKAVRCHRSERSSARASGKRRSGGQEDEDGRSKLNRFACHRFRVGVGGTGVSVGGAAAVLVGGATTGTGVAVAGSAMAVGVSDGVAVAGRGLTSGVALTGRMVGVDVAVAVGVTARVTVGVAVPVGSAVEAGVGVAEGEAAVAPCCCTAPDPFKATVISSPAPTVTVRSPIRTSTWP